MAPAMMVAMGAYALLVVLVVVILVLCWFRDKYRTISRADRTLKEVHERVKMLEQWATWLVYGMIATCGVLVVCYAYNAFW